MLIIIPLAVLMLLGVILLAMCAPSSKRRRAASFAGVKFAHRGLHGETCSENSIGAFRHACENGYGIELDVQFTKDKQLVVFHDDNAARMTGKDELIRNMTLEEIRALSLKNDGSRIPTFAEVLECVNGSVPLLVEIKTCPNIRELTSATAEMLKGYNGKYVVESFNPFCLNQLRKVAPEIIRGQLVTGRKEYKRDQSGIVAFLLSQLMLNVLGRPDFVAYNAKAPITAGFWLQKKVFHTPLAAWTITDCEQARSLSSAGIMPIFEKCKP